MALLEATDAAMPTPSHAPASSKYFFIMAELFLDFFGFPFLVQTMAEPDPSTSATAATCAFKTHVSSGHIFLMHKVY